MVQYFPIVTGSLTVTGSINVSGGITASGGISISGSIDSASFASTASFVALAQSASNAVAAQTASFANAFTVAGNLTAQTLVVQTITSSVDFVTGSTRFGSIAANTHVFTGSVSMNPGGLFVSSSGLVGIGTTNPANFLHINGLNPNLIIQNTTSSVGSEAVLTFRSTFGNGDIAYLGYIRAIQQSTSANTGDIAIHAYSAGSANEVIRIKGSSGNVGIACTDPTLVNITGTTAPLLQIRNSSDSSGQIRIGGSSSTSVGLVLDYSNSGYTTSTIRALYATTNDSCALNIDSGYIAFRTGTSITERMRVNGNGVITAPYMMGKYFDMTSGAGTGTAITDTGIYYNSGDWGGFGRSTIYLVTFSANPNNGGSGEYSAVHVGYITVYTGWSGSNVTTYVGYTQLAVGNNISTLTLYPTFWNGSSESNAVTRGSIGGYQIRIKISGYNSSFTGANQALYITKILTSG